LIQVLRKKAHLVCSVGASAKDNVMSHLVAAEEGLLIEEISDDALEAIALGHRGSAANFTVSFCTGADHCPGP
jgi:hypothetical protein